jgi:two-component system, OmpR family, sensor kinase
MIRALNTLAARTILISLLGIAAVHALSLWVYERALDRERAGAQEVRIADRLVSIKQSILLLPLAQREQAAHALSSGVFEAHWSATERAVRGDEVNERWAGLREQLRALAPELRPDDVVIGPGASDPHVAVVSMRLPDAGWLNVSLFAPASAAPASHGALLSTSFMALGVVLLSVLITRWLTLPIKRVAFAATHLTPGGTMQPVPEAGPQEVRELAQAFNGMQARITDLVARRTLALAAVSHDLRTPLTRLRLRVEKEPETRSAPMLRDISDMEDMIEATLSYLKGDEKSEAPRAIDLIALLDTIVGNARDAGYTVDLIAPFHLVISARRVGLKRALANLIENATRYGTAVGITVAAEADAIQITIEDNGPGIPEEQLATVFEPFVRLEASRNRETGGVGLGLTIAKSNIEANGGHIVLRNRPAGGLCAVVTLPAAHD